MEDKTITCRQHANPGCTKHKEDADLVKNPSSAELVEMKTKAGSTGNGLEKPEPYNRRKLGFSIVSESQWSDHAEDIIK